ncbi:sigma-54-dependent Fis family transcriptional regulator [Variovorax sp. YR752]|uniref:sigma-54-dependent Fis family transcriptional regulator n=1 Tax=Variovorax sp. YR752 TaxID=1884383 RepID=UPI0031376F4F
MTHAIAHRIPAARLRAARRQLLEQGDVEDGLIAPDLQRSWQRSARFGLAPSGRMPGAPHASGPQLVRALDHQRELVAHARPVMEYLFDQTRDTDSMVILADAQGMLLQSLGDASFVDRAQRVALRPGANWHEQWRGTNAIGTALADAAPAVVHAGEHYLERNGFLTCTAAPIADPCGRVLGVLDISGDHRGYHRHTLALVRSAARMIEHRLFDTRHAAGLRVRLHAQPEGIGTVAEGLLALSDDGWITGADAAARSMLGLQPGDCSARTIEHVLQLGMDALWSWARQGGSAPHVARRHDGSVLWLRVEAGRTVLALQTTRPVPRVAMTGDPLAALDSGDAAMHAAVDRARRVLDKPIALLLHGESGVGKEVFARAVHASSARRDGPFVAVNCAALPESLIEAELFGYRAGAFTGASREGAPGRIREAHGGTLFLDEIGDMPLAMQARLLRVLQDRQVVPLGGGKPVAVDFRLICATHRHLRSELDAGRFREDLYYRLNGLTLTLPPLRERQDQLALIERLLREIAPGRDLQLAPELAQAVSRYRWPGNLRQLHNALQTACALLDEGEAEIGWTQLPDDLAAELRDTSAPRAVLDDTADLRMQSERTVRQTVQACEGNLSEAARRLGISRNTLYRKLDELGLR